MTFWVNIQNGVVAQCRDTPPPFGDADWQLAVEVRPAIVQGTQYYGAHFFDTTKNPVEIVWPVLNFTPDETVAHAAGLAVQAREAAKKVRTAAVEAITVTTTAGNTFDGDETSQTRMARAIITLQATATPSTIWVLTNNTVIQATAAELIEALALAGAAQAAIWVI